MIDVAGKDVKTILLSLTTAGLMWLVQTVVSGHSTEAVLREKVASHETRISGLEGVAAQLAQNQARQTALQESMAKMLDRVVER